MEISYQNKTALLTGAGGGIGRAIALKLARQKFNLVLLGGRNVDSLHTTCVMCEEFTSCLELPGELTDLAFLDAGIKKAVETYGGIDLLVNNAGMTINSPFEDISMEKFDAIMAVNVRVPFYLMKQTLPYLQKSGDLSGKARCACLLLPRRNAGRHCTVV